MMAAISGNEDLMHSAALAALKSAAKAKLDAAQKGLPLHVSIIAHSAEARISYAFTHRGKTATMLVIADLRTGEVVRTGADNYHRLREQHRTDLELARRGAHVARYGRPTLLQRLLRTG